MHAHAIIAPFDNCFLSKEHSLTRILTFSGMEYNLSQLVDLCTVVRCLSDMDDT